MKHRIALALACLVAVAASATPASAALLAPPRGGLDAGAAARFAALALKCLHQEYPNHLSHTLNGAADARPPHELTPAFYGCLDWHSDVHGHWLLVRLARLFPGAPFASEAREAVACEECCSGSNGLRWRGRLHGACINAGRQLRPWRVASLSWRD